MIAYKEYIGGVVGWSAIIALFVAAYMMYYTMYTGSFGENLIDAVKRGFMFFLSLLGVGTVVGIILLLTGNIDMK